MHMKVCCIMNTLFPEITYFDKQLLFKSTILEQLKDAMYGSIIYIFNLQAILSHTARFDL